MLASIHPQRRRQALHLRLVGALIALPGLACAAFGLKLHVAVVAWAGVRGIWLGGNRYELYAVMLLALTAWAFDLAETLSRDQRDPEEPRE